MRERIFKACEYISKACERIFTSFEQSSFTQKKNSAYGVIKRKY
ncbi:hypothetical protein HMPREF9446_01385 [Bacteroides fluxus YIT 12057]|uniref:Uncharacterized protein n=1 Tax=Bacteroides fluxus YIT 12057 TaxID=763034 RepID=F3PRN4_9BACE|nr:hypothetical protein HMPREF9446_01385 [Bacteroides fluxus YIT 12057]